MKLDKVVDNIGTVTELKRIASAYVIDYRALNEPDIRAALKKTGPQYYHEPNVKKAFDRLIRHDTRDIRILSSLVLQHVLLHKDDFTCKKRETEDCVTAWEQSVIDDSNEDITKKTSERKQHIDLFEFLIDTAWQNNDAISSDEINLIEKVRDRMKITEREHRIIEAKLGKFPTNDNKIHNRSDIEDARRELHSAGLLFSIRDNNGDDFDVIPDEIANVLRSIFHLELRNHAYVALLDVKYVRSKPYLNDLLVRAGLTVEKGSSLDELRQQAIDHLLPSEVIGGFSPKDGLSMVDLRKWCTDLNLPISGTKQDLIQRIIDAYDALRLVTQENTDERAIFYEFFEDLAFRRSDSLRQQQLIQKDIEIERNFEYVTSYLFESKLGHKPLSLIGSAHADGAISYQDRVIYWDNKSKETPVSLSDHIKQFDSYIKSSEKPVAGFLVIGPDFTEDSATIAMQYQVQNGVPICLITASELKQVASKWEEQRGNNTETKFPLGYLLQIGRFNPALLASL